MIQEILYKQIEQAIAELYSASEQSIEFQKTRKDFDGDITLVVFPLLRASKKGAEQTAEEIGNYLKESVDEVTDFNVVKGFLNLSLKSSFWITAFNKSLTLKNYGFNPNKSGKTYMVEYSSPNTIQNKMEKQSTDKLPCAFSLQTPS